MTTDTISITIHSPDLVQALKQLAEVLTGKPTLLPEQPAAAPSAIEATIPTVPQTPSAVPAVPVAAAVPVVPPAQSAAVLPMTPAPINPVPVGAAPTYTIDALARAGATLVQLGKMDDAVALLAKYGVPTVNQLKPEQYGAFATDLRALGAQV